MPKNWLEFLKTYDKLKSFGPIMALNQNPQQIQAYTQPHSQGEDKTKYFSLNSQNKL